MPELSRKTGIVLLLVSALVFSTAGLFTKGVEAGAWEVIFWRGVFAGLFTTGYVFWQRTGRVEFSNMGRWGWLIALISAAGTAAFIPAFKHTSVANVVLIYAASPMLAAIMAWFWFKERMTQSVMLACVVAFSGVILIVSGSLESVHLKGDLLALWMTLCMTLVIVIYRRAPATPAAGPAVIASLLLIPPSLLLGKPLSIPFNEILILVAFGLIFAVASVTLSEGARRVPAGETALISSLESPFAIILAWLILSDAPALLTLLGGALVMAGVMLSQRKGSSERQETASASNGDLISGMSDHMLRDIGCDPTHAKREPDPLDGLQIELRRR